MPSFDEQMAVVHDGGTLGRAESTAEWSAERIVELTQTLDRKHLSELVGLIFSCLVYFLYAFPSSLHSVAHSSSLMLGNIRKN
ncbi:hypothetical protein BCR37DRAFT_377731 [Protomyces lactucae-debilis]|uniref:Uncharacterized protein n=1 Tax=Protomyces lactucae-debilis TaxID=2754530 RepID=A0A1Y2FLQ5_PROLT|nr:uncharacterized protein BCR37DRAFT_377731 [Protomyces lactucae-debilis]ORY84900.1 hypothetical protein BCR37DRAFT_377731 [Protomyces lactucae-debilis]